MPRSTPNIPNIPDLGGISDQSVRDVLDPLIREVATLKTQLANAQQQIQELQYGAQTPTVVPVMSTEKFEISGGKLYAFYRDLRFVGGKFVSVSPLKLGKQIAVSAGSITSVVNTTSAGGDGDGSGDSGIFFSITRPS